MAQDVLVTRTTIGTTPMSSLRDHIERTLRDADTDIAAETVPVSTGSFTVPQGR